MSEGIGEETASHPTSAVPFSPNGTGIHLATPHTAAQVRLPDGRTFEGPVGTPLESFFRTAYPTQEPIIVGALVDGELRELTTAVLRDSEAAPITVLSSDGARIYRRSLTFLLVAAAAELHPEARLLVEYSMPFGGYFCQVEGCPPFTPEEIAQLEAHMREMVDDDLPIEKERMPLDQALLILATQGYDDKIRLLRNRTKDYLILYRLGKVYDYFHGYMVPSTGYLTCFALHHNPPGFVLHFPQRSEPFQLQEYHDYPKLVAVFRQAKEWKSILGVGDVGGLNESVEMDRIREVVLVNEALHEHHIADIAQEIAQRRPQVRLVLIAGPSSSGKTTFAKRLSVQLIAHGLRPFALGLDDYFVDRLYTPRDANGDYDFESIAALDVALFNRDLAGLMTGESISLPRYNFVTGLHESRPPLTLAQDTVIVAEGIHALNPAMISDLPQDRVFRVYVSALAQLNLDKHNRVPTTDTRLIRRIVRDAQTRGYTATDTIRRWESVRRGEKTWIFPHQENADVMFNSGLVYELGALRSMAEPLLLAVAPRTAEGIEAKRLLALLRWFRPIDPALVPDNSILTEFIRPTGVIHQVRFEAVQVNLKP